MRRYYAYIRVSTQRQGEKGSSLKEQRDAIATFADRRGFSIVAWFEERETAAKSGRHEFTKMLGRLRAKKVDGVIFHKIDRGARNLKDWNGIQDLLEVGVDVQFAHESLDLNSRGGRLTADLLAVIAADYVRNLREEIKKGMLGRFKQGLYPLRAPIGYLDQGGGKAKIPDPHTAPLIRHAFRTYATGKYSLHSLRDELHKLGLKGSRGGPLSVNTVHDVLRNPFYTGIIRVKRTGIVYAALHEPLVSISLFDNVQDTLKSKIYRRSQKHDYLFKRLLRCSKCLRVLVGEEKKGRVYYRCHNKYCARTCIREDRVEAIITSILQRLRFEEADLEDLNSRICALIHGITEQADEVTQSITLKLDRVRIRLARLTDAFLDGLLTSQEMEEKKSELLFERLRLKEKLDSSPPGRAALIERAGQILERCQTASKAYLAGLKDQKRQTLKSLCSNLSVDKEKLIVKLHYPYIEVHNRFITRSSGAYRDTVSLLSSPTEQLPKTNHSNNTTEQSLSALATKITEHLIKGEWQQQSDREKSLPPDYT